MDLVEREPDFREEVHRGRSDFHWSAMAGHRVHGKQEVGL
jgi:hypothetical protein